jgi:hypothetical protein
MTACIVVSGDSTMAIALSSKTKSLSFYRQITLA